MKRIGYLYEKIFCDENIRKAIVNASKRKTQRRAFKYAMTHIEETISFIKENPFYNGIYKEETVIDKASGKARDIKVPDYKNLIIQHAIMQVVFPILSKTFYYHSYGALPNKGMFKASKYTRRMVRKNKYFSKDDVVKFYDNIRRDDIIRFVERKIKDRKVIDIISCRLDTVGVAIGNYISQILANFVMTPLDHYIKEKLRVDDYIRNMDDFIIFGNNKRELKKNREVIRTYIKDNLGLSLHDERNKLLSIEDNFVDFCGYKHYKDHTTLRKRTYIRYKNLIYKLRKYISGKKCLSFMSYWGFMIKTNCHRWLSMYMPLINMANIRACAREYMTRLLKASQNKAKIVSSF